MAKRKTTELTTITAASLAAGDWFPVVDVSDTTDSSTGTNKKLAKSELAEAAGLTTHLADTSDAHDASAISFAPTGTIAATDVQAAIAELDSEKAAVSEPIAAAHIADISDAHDASAISVLDAAGTYTATDVESVLAELPAQFRLVPVKSQPPVISSYFERFQSGHGWTILGGGASITDDTSDYVIGSQCATFQTRTDGTARSAEKAGYSKSLTSSQIAVTFKIDDTTNLTEIILYAGDTAFANYYQWTIYGDTSEAQRWFKSGEWVTMVLTFAGATTSGSPSRSTIQKLRFRVGASNGAAATTVKLGAIGAVAEDSTFPNGVVSITFDDLYASNWTKARPKLSEYGYPATIYAISDRIGETYMSVDKLRALEALGWEIGVHGNTSLTSMSIEAAEADVIRERGALSAYGFRGLRNYAYPQGGFSTDVMNMLKKHFSSARTICYRQSEALRPNDPMRLRAYSPSNTTTTTALTNEITAAYNNKGWLILTFHDIADTATLGTQYSTANFATVIDHINSTGIPVRTVGDVLSRFT